MFYLKISWNFSQFRYFKQIASFLNIKVPILNQQLQIQHKTNCIVHGVKKLHPLSTSSPNQNEFEKQQQLINIPSNIQIIAQQQRSHSQDMYEQCKNSQQLIPFEEALSISKKLDMDLCLMRIGSQSIHPVLSVSAFRKQIYTEYYLKVILKQKRVGFKFIRLSQRIQKNDVNTKVQNVRRLVRTGERKFKLIAINDSDKSQKVLIDFAKIFGKQIQPKIQSIKDDRNRDKDRWTADLFFDDQIKVDFDKVNKKWKRFKNEQQKAKIKQSQDEIDFFTDDNLQIEREMYQTYKQLELQMPPKYESIAQIQRDIQNGDKFALYKSVINPSSQNDSFQQQDDNQQNEWDSQQQRLYDAKMARLSQEYFKTRTVNEILSEMEELKRTGYQSQAHKVARYKKLKAQLEFLIKRPNDQM